jgi:MYXO-CTERM domain-containing protein
MTPLERAARVLLVSAIFSTATTGARADAKLVADSAGLAAAIAGAQPGDVITLADGTYPLTGITCAANGTAQAPITVKSASPLGAKLEFDALEGFHVTGAYWHFEGLDVRGVCATDDDCEHAFHVTGGTAEGFSLRKSRVHDFNAQLKVNAAPDANGKMQMANGGTVEFSEFFDGHSRATANPVTKLNIDGGVGWIVRGNYLHDFRKAGGNEISYGAFMKSGGSDGLFERNLVVCEKDDKSGGVRIGLSFGGGGTAAQFCAPAFDANVPCNVEHTGGIMRNNILAACSDVGIYINRGASTKVLHNTLIATNGVDFRFDTTTGESHANLLMGKVRARDGAMFQASDDVAEQPLEFFATLYADPTTLDLAVKGDGSALQKAPPRPDLTDDYCARTRPASNLAVGALEHALGDCAVLPPPEEASSTSSGNGAGGGAATGTSSATAGSGGAMNLGNDQGPASDAGCGCVLVGGAPKPNGIPATLALVALALTRTRPKKAA